MKEGKRDAKTDGWLRPRRRESCKRKKKTSRKKRKLPTKKKKNEGKE